MHSSFGTWKRPLLAGLAATVLALGGCGGGDDDGAKTTVATAGTQTLRAAALSLQSAMDASARAIDGVRGTRGALERLGASLRPTAAQTGDVIVLLTPTATEPGTATMLLGAAREQRSFLQSAIDATDARTRSAANSAIARARAAGRRASEAYAQIAQQPEAGLAGLLPASTTFNTGRLRDAVRAVNQAKPATTTKTTEGSGGTTTGSGGGGTTTPSATSCGDGITVNSVTTCPFAQNVRDEYRASGGGSVIQVFSPVTQRTYTMQCSGGVPTVCRGGNGAVVTFR